jgi:hypothetical protein
MELQDSLTMVSKSYQDTEDDSTITSDNLNEKMTKFNSIIDGWKKGGQASWRNDTAPNGDGSQSYRDPASYPKHDPPPSVDPTAVPWIGTAGGAS